MSRKKKIEQLLPEFIVMNDKAEYFAGMREGYFYWSSDFSDAKTYDEVAKYETIKRFEPWHNPELIYLDDM
jgi:hypothetical protein